MAHSVVLTDTQVLVWTLLFGASYEALFAPNSPGYVASLHPCADQLGQLQLTNALHNLQETQTHTFISMNDLSKYTSWACSSY